MRILELHAENVKRLHVVDITPGKGVVEIAGDNGNGKTSVLDAVLWLIGGKAAIQWEPIRLGEERAIIRAKLGDDDGLRFIVTRRFTAQEEDAKEPYTTSVVVEAADGSRPRGPQELLDSLYAGMAFDPLQFQRIAPKERIGILKDLVPGVDFAALEKRRAAIFDERTEVNRTAKILRHQAGEPPHEDAPDTLADTQAIVDRLAAATEQARQIEVERAGRQERHRRALTMKEGVADRYERAKALRAQAAALEQEAERMDGESAQILFSLQDLPDLPTLPDTDAIKAALRDATEFNIGVQAVLDYRERAAGAEAKEREAQALTDEIKGIDETVREAVANANLPVRGLALGELDVYLDGVPFGQASDAQQLRASLAVGIAMNPSLKVLRVRDGSLLDDKAMQILSDVMNEEGWQCFIERVHPWGPSAIILEEGRVKQP